MYVCARVNKPGRHIPFIPVATRDNFPQASLVFPAQSFVMIIHSSIYFPDSPVLSLSLGSKLNPDNIREGDDVYMECDVHARPRVDKIAWLINVRKKYEKSFQA